MQFQESPITVVRKFSAGQSSQNSALALDSMRAVPKAAVQRQRVDVRASVSPHY